MGNSKSKDKDDKKEPKADDNTDKSKSDSSSKSDKDKNTSKSSKSKSSKDKSKDGKPPKDESKLETTTPLPPQPVVEPIVVPPAPATPAPVPPVLKPFGYWEHNMEPATVDAFHPDIMEIKPGFLNGETVNLIAFRETKAPTPKPASSIAHSTVTYKPLTVLQGPSSVNPESYQQKTLPQYQASVQQTIHVPSKPPTIQPDRAMSIRPTSNRVAPASLPPPTARSDMSNQLLKMARDYNAMKAAKNALEEQNNELLGKIDELALDQPRSAVPPKAHSEVVKSELRKIDDEEVYDSLLNLRAKYRQEREENEKLRALLVGQAAKNKQAADALAPIVQEQPNVPSLMKAKDDVRRAEQVVREQERIIQKLEDLLERSMHTVDKRYRPEIDDLYNMTRQRQRYQPSYEHHQKAPRSAPQIDYKVDMLEHNLSKEKDRARHLSQENQMIMRDLEGEKQRSNMLRGENDGLRRENDDLKRRVPPIPSAYPPHVPYGAAPRY